MFTFKPLCQKISIISFRQLQITNCKVIQSLKRMAQMQLKQGVVMTYQVLQNAITYQLRITNTQKGLWMCIQEAGLNWKLTITNDMVEQTVTKASNSKQTMNLKEFTVNLLQAITKVSEKWTLGIMTPIQLQVLRGGTPSKQANNNKIYLILSDKEKKFHYPFTFLMSELGEKEKLIQAIKTMKNQLQELRVERSDKSQSSFSIMNETYNMSEQIKIENQQLKKKIRMCQQSLTQKRGAVQIDLILKEKNNLEIQAETKKREENKQIARLKNIYQMMEREIKQVQNQVQMINRELLMLEDSVGNSAKIKSHAMKVLKSYQNQLRTQKKVLQKQVKEIQTLKRNIVTSKNNQRKVQAKIKQIQAQIDQSKKKTNIKEISNRLHSVGRNNGSNADSLSSKSQSVGSSNGKPASQTPGKRIPVNLVRQNLIKKNMPQSSSSRNNNLLRTTPNMNAVTTDLKKTSNDKMPGRGINSSHQPQGYNSNTNQRLFNTQKYRSGSKSQNQNSSVRSDSAGKKKELTQQQKQKQRQRQKKALQRLAGPRAVVPKAPSNQKKNEQPNRLSSQNKLTSNSMNRGGLANKGGSLTKDQNNNKKDSAKEMLLKMKEIKAHYNNQTNKNANSKNFANKIADLTNAKNP